MPDPQIREHFRLGNLHRWTLLAFCRREDVLVRQHQQEVLQVVWRSPEPVLEAEHETAGILRLLNRQVLENSRKRVQKLEHGVLETSTTGLLPLFHEAGDRALALAQLSHGKAAELVQTHHLRHGGEHNCRFEPVAMGCNGIHHLLCQIFDEDQRGDEHIRLCHVLTETGVVLLVTELFDQIAAQLDSKFTAGRIESCCRLSQRVLVLGLKHHINRLHHGLVVLSLYRSNAAIGGADLCEHLRVLSNVKNLTASRRLDARIRDRELHESPHRLWGHAARR